MDDHVCLHENDFNIGQTNNTNCFNEAASCFDSDNW